MLNIKTTITQSGYKLRVTAIQILLFIYLQNQRNPVVDGRKAVSYELFNIDSTN